VLTLRTIADARQVYDALRLRGRHLWNPSNLGVSMLLFIAPNAVASLSQQMGNEVWPLLIIFLLGTIILYQLGRLHITLTYVAAFLALSVARTIVNVGFGKVQDAPLASDWDQFLRVLLGEVAPLTGPMYQLFIFFMITDPKTTVRAKWGQYLVAFLVAAVEAVLRLFHFVHSPYYALFLVGPAANLVEIVAARRARTTTT
jgi:Na+-translocating ferredoxin:NAD+ oxidoreductase RnfD subunit